MNAHHQATALCEAGIDVTVLCPPDWRHAETDTSYRQQRTLVSPPPHGSSSRMKSRWLTAKAIWKNASLCDAAIRRGGFENVLFASYMEYLAPLWTPPLRRYRESGVWFGAMVLDPARDYVVGPAWWHQRSVSAGYSFLCDAFVHHDIDLRDHGAPGIPTTVVPHGDYPMPNPTKTSMELRQELQVPPGDTVVLCYGHLRDNKNLQTSIDAIASVQNITLVVAGSEAAPGQQQSAQYQHYASERHVGDKVRWLIGYQSEIETANLFTMADVALMPYDKSFVSASGILYIAVPFQVPMIVSCGDGPLAQTIQEYSLGVRMSEPSVEAIQDGLQRVLSSPGKPRWEAFQKEQSYERNAAIVIERMKKHRTSQQLPESGIKEV
ncbi:glycosyltransferase family 4 protein [Allorhodopirellula solitaria]|nr:glycosyltransferase family 4 protein [Allorhodopirellula solitaria]